MAAWLRNVPDDDWARQTDFGAETCLPAQRCRGPVLRRRDSGADREGRAGFRRAGRGSAAPPIFVFAKMGTALRVESTVPRLAAMNPGFRGLPGSLTPAGLTHGKRSRRRSAPVPLTTPVIHSE